MPVMRCPQTGRTYAMGEHEAGRIRTALRLGWLDVTPNAVEKRGVAMPVLQNPKTGELAEVAVHEQERIAKLTREGWVDVSGQPVTVGIEVIEEEKTPHRTGDPVLVITEKPIEVTTQELSVVEEEKPKRKRD